VTQPEKQKQFHAIGLKADVNLNNEYDPQKHSPLLNDLERRAFALKCAIDSMARDVNFREDSVDEKKNDILTIAKAFDEFIVGAE
jgi:hypothetical protein